ncbi:phage holin family protein [Formosa sp. S-31]|uniref:phage holin family protein n=1 Tax=Formosa sp. S-31 TaxID=2790949 RepID=UPI003EB781EF
MKTLNFFVQGFGFDSLYEFRDSAFGHLYSPKTLSIAFLLGAIETLLKSYFGIPLIVFSAFALLNVMEFKTGIKASQKKGEKVESRKMGRMFLKVGVYMVVLFMLNSFMIGLDFPQIMDFEMDPFVLLYWAFLSGVIIQLVISLLENLEALGYPEASGILGYIKEKLGKPFKKQE